MATDKVRVDDDDRCGCPVVIDAADFRLARILAAHDLDVDSFLALDAWRQREIIRGYNLDDDEDAETAHEMGCPYGDG